MPTFEDASGQNLEPSTPASPKTRRSPVRKKTTSAPETIAETGAAKSETKAAPRRRTRTTPEKTQAPETTTESPRPRRTRRKTSEPQSETASATTSETSRAPGADRPPTREPETERRPSTPERSAPEQFAPERPAPRFYEPRPSRPNQDNRPYPSNEAGSAGAGNPGQNAGPNPGQSTGQGAEGDRSRGPRDDRRDDRFSRKSRRRFRNRPRDRRDRSDRPDRPDRNFGGDRPERSDGGDYGGAEASDFDQVPPDDGSPPVYQEGVVEVSGKGFGFLREARSLYVQSKYDTFVTPEVIRRYNLRDGIRIKGQVRRGVRGPQLFKLTEIEGKDPEALGSLPVFEELTTINPLEWLKLETSADRYTTRVIDLMAPVGKGQRGLIVAPPRTGKTTLLQHIADAVVKNHPEIKLMILLVDERPEEVTEIRRTLPTAELFASSNDSDLKSHTRIAQLAIERARRLVEMGQDVFLLLDSLTRVGRAFNNAQSGGGRTMSGGVDTRALEIPRRLFASARNTEEAGSLTIMATALIETGSRMDELIFLEFKGTGNMELVLDRRISDQRIYPAVDIFLSGTRREELLLPADSLHKISVIRRGLAGHKPIEAMERLLFFLRKHPTNAEMLAGIPG